MKYLDLAAGLGGNDLPLKRRSFLDHIIKREQFQIAFILVLNAHFSLNS